MVYWRRFTRTGHLSLHPEKHPKEESCVKKLVSLLIVLCLFPLMLLPASAAASGFWRTVEGGLPPEEQWLPVSDYTGEIRITFLGDCTLGGESPSRYRTIDFAARIAENGMEFPFRELIRLTAEDDLTVANLEGVLSDRKLSKVKKKFNFIGPSVYSEVLTLGSVACVTLANNHSHDYGDPGYRDTKSALEQAGICWFGTDAPAIWQSDEGLRIGFLGVSGSLSGNRAKTYQLQAEKLQDAGCAAIITVMHAGTEYSYDPPDGYQKQITNLAVPVSCLIIGHHPHVVQGYTLLDRVPVVYSLGNCVFGGNTMPRDFDALVVQAVLHFTDGIPDRIDLHFHPISISSDSHYNNYSPRFLADQDAQRVLQKMADSTGMDPGEWNEAEGAVVSVALD